MKIYFTAAISQKDKFSPEYKKIVETLEKEGHTVQSDQILNTSLDHVMNESDEDRVNFYSKVLKWISQSDLLVVEGSFPSTLNIGHEITLGLNKGKPVVVLYKKGYDSVFLHGLSSEKLFLAEYTDETLPELVRDTVDYAKDQSDTRFNFFISPSLSHYLDWVSTKHNVPRSVYLRQLIEADREQNKAEYDAT